MEERRRIEIKPNGPYVVHGDVPIKEMAPVYTLHGEPVDWHTLRDLPARPGPVELCRCGRSSTKPFCDSSHETNGFRGAETADRHTYEERAQVDRNGEDAIADDGSLCVSAGFCHTRTTDVWRLLAQSDDQEKRDLMRTMVWNCPSGRLVILDPDDNQIERELPQEIAAIPGGPLWVRGAIPITSSDGSRWETRYRVTLCRCGHSANKPFCDSTHTRIHFDER